jgi:hypothetical protein
VNILIFKKYFVFLKDGFYVGEMMNGERGLVPSNFVERIAEDEVILKESDEIGIKIVGP